MKLLAVLLFACLLSCGVSTHTEIVVEFPPFPPFWPEELVSAPMELRYLEGPGRVGEVVLAPGVRQTRVRIQKLPVVPFAASPSFGEPPAALGSCGGVYPADCPEHGEIVVLTWEEGFLADMLVSCAASGNAVQAVNVEKLQSEIMERSGGNPRLLQAATLRSAIVNGTLNYRSLRLQPVYEVSLEASPGRWISGDPLSPLPIACDGVLRLSGLSEGMYSFFLLGGSQRIDIHLSATGWTAVHFAREAGAAGNW